ncbi:Bug family tripartite tricarboxylate transporter substrate binding protein [Agrobacterium vitis]|uniref:Bug family tripartite tricarboxylate transporter substrate binding protein n=1 Tax=Agrobacterium vitis TaxID=373 RepID=UPI003D2AAA3A
MISRRNVIKNASALALSAASGIRPSFAAGQAIAAPGRLRIIAPGSVGGGYDGMARSFETVLRAAGVIDSAQITNIPGAGGTVGLAKFAQEFDGRTDAWLASGSTMVSAIIANKVPIDLSATTPLARLFGTFNALVVPASSAFKSLGDLVAALRSDPGSVSWAGGSIGGGDHLIAGMVAKAAGIDPKRLNFVPFTGGGEILAALLGGHVTMASSGWSEFSEQIRAGQIRCLGITADQPTAGISVPTLRDQNLDVVFYSWGAVQGPPAISPADRDHMLAMVDTMVSHPAWKVESEKRGWIDYYLPGAAYETFVKQQANLYRHTLSSLGLA